MLVVIMRRSSCVSMKFHRIKKSRKEIETMLGLNKTVRQE